MGLLLKYRTWRASIAASYFGSLSGPRTSERARRLCLFCAAVSFRGKYRRFRAGSRFVGYNSILCALSLSSSLDRRFISRIGVNGRSIFRPGRPTLVQTKWTGQIPNIYCTLLISSAIVGYCGRCKYCCRYLYNASVYYFLEIKLIHGPKRIEIIYQKSRYLSLSLAR